MKGKYPRELETPLEPMSRPPLTVDADEFLKRETEKRQQARAQKLRLLMSHYGIETNDPACQTKLLWALIEDHVPGLSVEDCSQKRNPITKKWNSKTWTVSKNLQMIADFARLRQQGHSITDACKSLAETDRYRGVDSLRKRYDEARAMPFAVKLAQVGLTHDGHADLWQMQAQAWVDAPKIEELNNSFART